MKIDCKIQNMYVNPLKQRRDYKYKSLFADGAQLKQYIHICYNIMRND